MSIANQCPLPENINPLSSNGFLFSINSMPEVSFFCQEVELPEITIGNIGVQTPLSKLKLADDVMEFGTLTVTFLIDEQMLNYVSVYNWITGLGFPESYEQYSTFINTRNIGYTTVTKESSNATLAILGSNNKPVKFVNFYNILPISLSSATFRTTNEDVTYITGTAVFEIERYDFP